MVPVLLAQRNGTVMSELLPDLFARSLDERPAATALVYRKERLSYAELWEQVRATADGLVALGIGRGERVAIYMEKRLEAAVAIFAVAAAGAVFVPLNPLLRARQVAYILRDCNVRILVTSPERLAGLADELMSCPDLHGVVVTDGVADAAAPSGVELHRWSSLAGVGAAAAPNAHVPNRVIDTDMAAILYTSGSTGMPKGVVLSHRNLVAGARSVSQYLENNPEDRILSVLPLSFDAGLSQLTTAFNAGATVVLINYLLPGEVVRLCAEERITGMTCVAPLWIKLAQQDWPAPAAASMRYFANTGGHMPLPILNRLRASLPHAKPFLMYGLTEAFRSTYLDPAEVDRRPDSIGKAIPNAEIFVVNEHGERCRPGQEGELVHRGALVAMGYWNDPQRTAERFRPAPFQPPGLPLPEIAVWSGDTVRLDEEGFIFFVGRRDEMIKTSGYRISPTEIEEVVYATGLVGEAAAIGIPDPALGHEITLVVAPASGASVDVERLTRACRQSLPLYMVPARIIVRAELPRSPNGKIDRKLLSEELRAEKVAS